MTLSLHYTLSIPRPSTHTVEIRLRGTRPKELSALEFFLPVWSPGSYLIREYSRHIWQMKATTSSGASIALTRSGKSTFLLDWKAPGLEVNLDQQDFEIIYQVYCHEMTVRTSHVDELHAFLHGPTLFLGLLDHEVVAPTLEVKLPPQWSKITTGLKDISPSREVFLYQAASYDELVDSPLELGCHETDGFQVEGIDHELAFYGAPLTTIPKLKQDIKVIVETVLKMTCDIPYEKYTFITHFAPGLFGGLEHSNSTALQYCPLKINERKGYLNWLSLVAHEYFHTWNVKRIRPVELGPFDYLNEAMTSMHWLTEGLTSFVDELFVVRAGLCTLEEYLDMQKVNLNRYFATPGRRFHSLEDSSFLSWIKLYRPDENSANSSVSYYLKGGIVFSILNKLLVDKGSSIDQLVALLWKRYLANPKLGVTREEVLQMVDSLAGREGMEQFESMLSTTEELPLEQVYGAMGVEFEFEPTIDKPWIGARWRFDGERVLVEAVELDGPAHRAGLNAGDEVLGFGQWRVLKSTLPDVEQALKINQTYPVMVHRLGRLVSIELSPAQAPLQTLKAMKIQDSKKLAKYLGVQSE
jgi:predicted metalloprotease with PDZ domain